MDLCSSASSSDAEKAITDVLNDSEEIARANKTKFFQKSRQSMWCNALDMAVNHVLAISSFQESTEMFFSAHQLQMMKSEQSS
jgi:hypothetical protein